MKIQIQKTTTNYLEIDSPLYYKSPNSLFAIKLHETGMMKAHPKGVINYEFRNGIADGVFADDIRDIIEKGIPITKDEFMEMFTKGINHLSIIAS